MKTLSKLLISILALAGFASASNAQTYQLANQVTNMIQNAIIGGANYRGFVEVSYLSGLGTRKASFAELSTTQGFKYGSMFFMGVGAGIDLMSTQSNDNGYKPSTNTTTSAAMVPLFTDFRLNFGQPQNTNVFIDLRLGAAFYIGNKYILVGDGYVNSSESFYLRPSLGVRIPVSSANSKYAMNISACYQLLTNSYWYNPGYNNSITLSSIGIALAFEW